jgi:CRISPR-associated exonuclease Cas4
MALLFAIIFLALAALALFIASRAPFANAEPEPLLVDEVQRLRGRPDYILEKKGKFIPVELKPLRESATLYDSDLLQLGTYLLLVRANHPDAFAGYGYVRYREKVFRVPLTPALEARCLDIARRVRAARTATEVHRTHNIAAKCAACAHRAACGESLV